MALDPRLLAVLACPVDKGPLYALGVDDTGNDGGLYNPRLRRRYVVREGIPVMLPDEAVEVAAAEADALDARIAAGDLLPNRPA
ncbi:MAG TPA: protein YcaR in KDO2-Lipid A biosynthesis cluster [Acidimicrobiaceae bacterium]|nr:protein YcaR in KDO2-Lipid A biosynthesis cluster [Acidimicrobiaceae bacterium]